MENRREWYDEENRKWHLRHLIEMLKSALADAKRCGMDEHFISEVKHLIGTAQHEHAHREGDVCDGKAKERA